MEELILADLEEAIYDILHDGQHVRLAHPAALLEKGAEVPLVAKLSDDIAVGGLSDDVEASKDVGVLQLGERFDLAVQHLAADSVTHALHVDGLDGHCFTCVEGAILVWSLVPR